MLLTSEEFKQLNKGKNNILRTQLYEFHTKVESAGLSIKIPCSGIETYQIDGKHFKAKSGEFILVNEGQELLIDLKSQTLVESICVYLDSNSYSQILESYLSGNKFDYGEEWQKYYLTNGKFYFDDSQLANELQHLQAYKDLSSFNEAAYITLTEKLVLHQLKQQNLLKNIRALSTNTKLELLKRIRTTYNYIMDNFQSNLSLEEIARVSSLSKFHLLRTFKDIYKRTPHQVLLARRVYMAKEQLKDGNTLENVVLLSGFQDYRALSRAFKKIEGYTPYYFQKYCCD